ncbi:efflux transporter outer membrane subunit [Hydrogenophaga sp. 5NK40-0174]|uniref:efflux transporter outer membrane subunit n=1 Tax=Hydrogenophaga sp. 5NK40-0174 TaxID=3127649 RepID=UPI00310B2EF4
MNFNAHPSSSVTIQWRPTLLAIAASLLLAACASAPPGPSTGNEALIGGVVPARVDGITTAAATTESLPSSTPLNWTALVQDDRLRQIIELALAHNRDLRLAALNIDAARAQYRITEADRLPTLSASAGSNASRSSTLAGGTGTVSHQYSASLGITSWELDLWGRLGKLEEAALSSYLSTQSTRDAVQASLITEVAQAWLTVQANQALQDLAQQTLDSRTRSLDLTRRRHDAGAVSGLDMATAQASMDAARASLASAQTSLAQSENTLRLLVGTHIPETLLTASGVVKNAVALAPVPEGLSSSALLNRPDVKSAEQNVQAALAKVGAARAALLPTITLTASAGTASHDLRNLFSAGSGTWSFAPTIKLPLFDGGASRTAVELAQITQAIEVTTYEQTVQTAFKEVADALAERASIDTRIQAQASLVQAYQRTLSLTEERYRAGAVNSLSVLDAQRSLYSAQQSLISLQLAEQGNRLTLYKALGGA